MAETMIKAELKWGSYFSRVPKHAYQKETNIKKTKLIDLCVKKYQVAETMIKAEI